MGFIYVDVGVSNPSTPDVSEKIRVRVDTGATLSVLPASMLERLGILRMDSQRFRSSGNVVTRARWRRDHALRRCFRGRDGSIRRRRPTDHGAHVPTHHGPGSRPRGGQAQACRDSDVVGDGHGIKLYGLDPLRPAPVQAGHRRLDGARPDACTPGDHHGRGQGRDPGGPGGGPDGDRGRQLPLARRARRHPHEHRAAPPREDRSRRGQAAHGALPERPGRDGHAGSTRRAPLARCWPRYTASGGRLWPGPGPTVRL